MITDDEIIAKGRLMMNVLDHKRQWGIFISLVITAFFSLSFLKEVANAEDKGINLILSEDHEKSPAIFDDSDLPLAPGVNINKSFYIQNRTNRSYCIIGIKINKFNLKDSNNNAILDETKINYFCDNLKCKIGKVACIGEQALSSVIYEGSLRGLTAQDGISINDQSLSISSGGSEKFNIDIWMENSADNRLQGLSGNIDIQIAAASRDGESSTIVIGGNNLPAAVNTNSPAAVNNKDDEINKDSGNNDVVRPKADSVPAGLQVKGWNDVNNQNSNGIKRLIKTGSFFDTASLIIIGSLLIAAGILTASRKQNK